MTGELAAFLVFIGLMLLMVWWLIRRSARTFEEQHERDVEHLKKDPP